MDSDDVTESMHDWEVFESLGIDDNLSALAVTIEGWVNDLECANKSVGVDFVWESSINDDTIEMAWVG